MRHLAILAVCAVLLAGAGIVLMAAPDFMFTPQPDATQRPYRIVACLVPQVFTPADAKYADVVVTGRVVDYQVVLDQASRRMRRQWLWRSGNWINPRQYAQRNYPGDHARFDVVVDQVLKGKAPRRVRVTVGGPAGKTREAMLHAPVMIALVPTGPDNSYEPGAMTIRSEDCKGDFLLAATPENVTEARQALNPPPKRPAKTVVPVFAAVPSVADEDQYGRSRLLDDEVEGSAAVDCALRDTAGRLNCTVVSETPQGQGFGAGAVNLFAYRARLDTTTGAYRIGDHFGTTWHWRPRK